MEWIGCTVYEMFTIKLHCDVMSDVNTSLQHCGSCTGYLCGNVSSTSWRVSPSVNCRAWRRITSPATVSWLPIPDGDPCGPPNDVSALCHVRTALSAIDPSRLPVRVHGTSCLSVYVTLGYSWLLLMPTWRHTYFLQCSRPRRICDIYDFFAPHINVLTYLLTLLTKSVLFVIWGWYCFQ